MRLVHCGICEICLLWSWCIYGSLQQRHNSYRMMDRWRHKLEEFPRYWPFVRGIHRSPVDSPDSPHKGQRRGALIFSLICAWTNDWANNRIAGDLLHRCAHYGVAVMIYYSAYALKSSSSHPYLSLSNYTPALLQLPIFSSHLKWLLGGLITGTRSSN